MFKRKILKVLTSFLLSWCCFLIPIQAEEPIPDLNSAFMILQDIDTGQVLAQVRGQERIYPASMTKLMTAIIAIEELPNTSERLVLDLDIMSNLIEVNASMAGFGLYDDPSVMDCLYGTLLPSGAECANALALRVSGSYEGFVEKMNQKAQELEMNDTHFTNPTGLHEEDQYSTCEDIAKLLSYCSKNETFMNVISTKEYLSTPTASYPQGLPMTSHVIVNLEDVDGFHGGKTGYTPDAGRCLASLATIDGMNLVLVTAFSGFPEGPLLDASSLYHWAKENYDQKEVVSPNTLIKTIPILDSKEEDTELLIYPSTSIKYDCKVDSTYHEDIQLLDSLTAPLEEGTRLGTYRYYVDDKVVYEETFYLDHTIQQNNKALIRDFIKNKPYLVLFYGAALLLLFLFLISFFRSRRN